MRAWLSALLLLALAADGFAQDPGEDGQEPAAPGEEAGAEGEKKAEEPKEPPLWKMDDRDRRSFERYFEDYLRPGRKSRQDYKERLQRTVERKSDEHSLLEDVAAIAEIAHRTREFDPRLGRKGRITQHEIAPGVHGFPGGVGTVRYWIWLPKRYSTSELWPVIFCLPDNRKWPEGGQYIQEVWVKRSPEIAEEFVIVVPAPQAKGDSWSTDRSYARAMISLRHVCGTFDIDKRDAGPASDLNRLYLDGGDVAAITAARFPELFRGVILRGADGTTGGSIRLAKYGGISGLPAYCIHHAKKTLHKRFAEKVKRDNEASVLVAAAEDDESYEGDAKEIVAWMKGLPRETQPKKLMYRIHDPSFQRCFWINVLEFDAAVEGGAWFEAEANRATNVLEIRHEGLVRFELFLNDHILDLNRKIRVVLKDGKHELVAQDGEVTRDLGTMLEELVVSNHPWRVFPVRLVIDVDMLRVAKMEEEAAKAEAAEQGGGDAGKKAGPAAVRD